MEPKKGKRVIFTYRLSKPVPVHEPRELLGIPSIHCFSNKAVYPESTDKVDVGLFFPCK
jgi:hypothetical protein